MAKNTDTDHDSSAEINWLEHWDPIRFITDDPKNDEKIRKLKRKLRVYIRGELAEHNAVYETYYVAKKIDIRKVSDDPLKFSAKAFLDPPAKPDPEEDPESGGGHLIPPTPPPPDEIK